MFDIGSTLRDARLRQGLDFPELEQITKIRPKYLRALEDERFDVLPAPTYVKGFLRSYAEALGLDGQPFVDEYNSRFAVGEEEQSPIRTRRAPVRKAERGNRESRIAVLALLGIAIVTALVIAAWRFGGTSNPDVPGLALQSQAPSASAASRRSRVTLAVHAVSGSSWMEIRTGPGFRTLAYSGTLERGQHKRFQGRVLHVILTEPQNVSVRLDGRRRELPSGTTFVVTRRHIARAAS